MVRGELVGILRKVEDHGNGDDEDDRKEIGPQELDDNVSVESRKNVALDGAEEGNDTLQAPFLVEGEMAIDVIQFLFHVKSCNLQPLADFLDHLFFPCTEIIGEDIPTGFTDEPEIKREIVDASNLQSQKLL